MKRMDCKQDEIDELAALLKGRLTSYQRFSMEREMKPEGSRQNAERRWQTAVGGWKRK